MTSLSDLSHNVIPLIALTNLWASQGRSGLPGTWKGVVENKGLQLRGRRFKSLVCHYDLEKAPSPPHSPPSLYPDQSISEVSSS